MRVERQERAESSGGRRVSRFFRDVSITFVAQACVAIGGLLLARLLATEVGRDGFASYSLVKQAANVLFPVVTVGLVGGLPRYLAMPRDVDSPTSEAYLAAGWAIAGSATALACLVALTAPATTASLFFGDEDATELVLPFVLLLAATSIFYLAYGYFRGLLRLRAGGALQVAGLAVLPPLVVVLLPGEPISTLIVVMALGLAVLSLSAVAVPLARAAAHRRGSRARAAASSLWDYGHRRVPGEMAQLGLFVLVPIIAAHAGTLTDVAYLSAGQQVLSILSIAVLPLGLVLLPSLTAIWARDKAQASRYVGRLTSLALHVALFAGVQAVIYADLAVRLWLGAGFEDAGAIVRVTATPAAAFVVYLMLRSALDAVAVKSYNSRNNLVALGVLLGVAAAMLGFDLAEPGMAVAVAFAAGVTTQGALTLATVHSVFRLRGGDYGLAPALLGAAALGVLALLARPFIEGSGLDLALLLLLELLLAGVYAAGLFHVGVPWALLLRERFFDQQD
jgi:O-antigen/teichoic acid export membrane protein